MKHRKLRIAWSVAWGSIAVLIFALWVRSYWRMDLLQFPAPGQQGAVINSRGGLLRFSLADNLPRQFDYLSLKVVNLSVAPQATRYGFAFESIIVGNRKDLTEPYWIFTLFATVFAVTPWLRSRFSLRSLLIATTLVAIGLGLIVWLR